MGIPNRPIRIFLCYAREDEPLLRDLEKQLRLLQRQGFIEVWHDREISPGANWEQEIAKYINTADIILLLVSPDFINSDYCYSVEMQRAMERHQAGEVRIIPVILRPVSWQNAPFGKIQALPTDAKPVTGSGWQSQEEAFYDVAESIRKVVEKLMMETINSSSIRADENEITNAQTSIGKSILGSGTANDHTLVSSPVPENLTERNTPRPFVSSSDYSGGDVASVPFFPNSHTKQEDVGLPSDRPRTTRLPRVISPLALRLSIVLIVLLALIGGGGRLYYTGYYLPAQQHAFATATARSVGTVTARNNAILAAGLVANNPYPATSNILISDYKYALCCSWFIPRCLIPGGILVLLQVPRPFSVSP